MCDWMEEGIEEKETVNTKAKAKEMEVFKRAKEEAKPMTM